MQAMKTGLAALLIGLTASLASAAETMREITVSGQGEVSASPDMATIRIGVTQEAPEARAAMQATSASVAQMLTRLDEFGIAKTDVQTRRLTVNPVWSNRRDSNGPAKITGFVASNTINVRIRDLDRLGEILDQVMAEGANEFNGLQFSLQDPDPLVTEARKAAVADAMEKAALYAEAAGVTLGPVQQITEQGGNPRPMMMEMASMARDAAVPIAEGEVTVQASVTMVFSIAE